MELKDLKKTYSGFLERLDEIKIESKSKARALDLEYIKGITDWYHQCIKSKKSNKPNLNVLELIDKLSYYEPVSFFGSDNLDENENKIKILKMKIKEINIIDKESRDKSKKQIAAIN